MSKDVKYERGLGPALAALRAHMGKKPLFTPPTRRSIPMRHRELGILLAGEANPGLPTGVFIETLGAAHSGKTSLAFAFADAVVNQAPGTKHRIATDDGIEEIDAPRRVLYIDHEHALDTAYLSSAVRNCELAVVDSKGRVTNQKTANVYVHQPDTLEEGGDIMLHLIASGEFGLVVNDSVAAMLGDEEKRKSMSESTMGLQARAVGKLLRKSAHMVRRYGVTVVMVNQWRDKIGISFGDPRVAPGGKALEYWDMVRLNVSGPHKTDWFDDGKTCKVTSMKNKVTGLKGVSVEYALGRGVGLSAEVELTQRAVSAGLLSWRGGMLRPVKLVANDKTFPAMRDWLAFLRGDPKLFAQLSARCDRAGVTRPARSGNGGFAADDDG